MEMVENTTFLSKISPKMAKGIEEYSPLNIYGFYDYQLVSLSICLSSREGKDLGIDQFFNLKGVYIKCPILNLVYISVNF